MLQQNLCCYFVWGWGRAKITFYYTFTSTVFHCIRVGEVALVASGRALRYHEEIQFNCSPFQ